jgi:hypothetical protein
MAFPLASMLRTTISYEGIETIDGRDTGAFLPPIQVQCRVDSILQDVITGGEVTTATQRVVLLFEPALRDKLGGREVIGVESMNDMDNNSAGWRALTR